MIAALVIAVRQSAEATAVRAEARRNYAAMVWAAVQRLAGAVTMLLDASERIEAANSSDPLRFQVTPVLREIELVRLFRPYRDLDNSVLAMNILSLERACTDFLSEFDSFCASEESIQSDAKAKNQKASARVAPRGVLAKAQMLETACRDAAKALADAK